MQVVKDYCRAVGAPTDEQSMLKRLAADTGLKPVSIALMLSGCSYLSVDRLRRLREKLPAGKKVDLAMLGNDPRVTVEETVVKAPEAPTPAPPPAKGAEPAAQVVPIPKPPATALMAASGPAVMILGADGSIRLVPAVSYPCVISISAKGEANIHCPPAGTSFGKGNVMEADDGTGVISVAFYPDPAESPRP